MRDVDGQPQRRDHHNIEICGTGYPGGAIPGEAAGPESVQIDLPLAWTAQKEALAIRAA